MRSIIEKYKLDFVWHFTDQVNIELIVQHNGLHSLGNLQRKGIAIPAPGGNQWSHDADVLKGVHEYVHLAFLDDHPMLYTAKQPKFDTSCTQVIDFIRNGLQSVDYKTGLAKSDGVGGVKSSAVNSDF